MRRILATILLIILLLVTVSTALLGFSPKSESQLPILIKNELDNNYSRIWLYDGIYQTELGAFLSPDKKIDYRGIIGHPLEHLNTPSALVLAEHWDGDIFYLTLRGNMASFNFLDRHYYIVITDIDGNTGVITYRLTVRTLE